MQESWHARALRDACLRPADNVLFHRNARKREIDALIQDGRVLHPVEIKVDGSPGTEAT